MFLRAQVPIFRIMMGSGTPRAFCTAGDGLVALLHHWLAGKSRTSTHRLRAYAPVRCFESGSVAVTVRTRHHVLVIMRGLTVLSSVGAILLLSVVLTYSVGRSLKTFASTTQLVLPDQSKRIDTIARSLAELSRLLEAPASLPAFHPPPTQLPPPPPPSTSLPAISTHFNTNFFDGNYLIASHEALPTSFGTGSIDVNAARQLLKSLLGLARLLNRQLILPAALCNCEVVHQAGTLKRLTNCVGEVVAPFGCPLRAPLDRLLPLDRWQAQSSTASSLRPADLLVRTPKAVPADLRRSHVRVLLPDGMSDGETRYALRSYGDTRVLEIERALHAYCGWDPNHDHAHEGAAFEKHAEALLEPPDAKDAATHAPTALNPCTHFHGGAGEVQRFTNVGTAGDYTAVSAAFADLPESVRNLPNGSDLVITFATGSVATMALNWASAARKAGVNDILIGALDELMMNECAKANQPCVLIRGGNISRLLSQDGAAQNLRSRPSLYPKMSVLKVGFYRELLSYGYNVWACDADAVLVGDPRPLMREPAWQGAHIAAATDCIDIPLDNRSPLLHCDLNTGLVYMRATPEVLDFVGRWRETIASAKELRIRDQAAFNMLLKQRPLRRRQSGWLGGSGTRLYTGANGPSDIVLGILPLSRFLNGHTYFVQHAHTLPAAAEPLVVHMTYQFAEGAKFAYGKRQRLRQAGLWLVDDDSYYNGKYVRVADDAATLPPTSLPPYTTHSKDAIERHLAEARHRSKVLRNLLGIAKALGRELILPRMLCYCDFMWKEMKACRVGGAESMRLPFECPMDHVLDTPRWFETPALGVGVREPMFLSNPRVPPNVTSSIARDVKLPRKGMPASEVRTALAQYADTAVIEFADVVDAFCGFDGDAALERTFLDSTRRLLEYKRSPFCYEDHVSGVPPYSQCCRPRKPGDAFFPCIQGFDDPEPLVACTRG